ncbi:hypothetical protein CLAFUW4_05411 [Fulvia fulva]|uniref:Uncharacterized protein n=1 Tax=Passalora fulva TaxID=5499 RepID=A0A9Q8LID5_PASFU|nr:uncharacterized protein CLAFUR5_05558 [Fulvia fulva]KAK4624430.1 hypothetical protein CLAFUR4_05405 [Fulvia fulva]KAK4625894.1 hypothetical protein CLAFUR0_05413 [Fulvia fulva]UJO17935.1 hypothetical protein CLAFUR5_05558 [Fulvia fulva]WPV15012.1 hypothetical protein CLAFUW4_05411 [Fulvia fulva]WPV29893.1 hypothetical protein CLAFUW7_05409 [Fulvia fulva]
MFGGGRGHHGFNIQTTPMVAYIEAFGLFAERFALFITRSERHGAELHKAFVDADSRRSGTSRVVERIDPIAPAFGRGDVEGAVYGAVFVHFASLVTLATAVEADYRSDALNFSQYRAWILSNKPAHISAINQVKEIWGM